MKNKNIFNKIIGFIIIILLCIFLGLLSYFQNRPLIDINEDILRVYYLNVGQADCTLVVNNGETMLIDGANEADTNLIIKYRWPESNRHGLFNRRILRILDTLLNNIFYI